MRLPTVSALLLLGASLAAADAPSAAACRARCKSLRPGVLDDVSVCTPAFKLPPERKLFHACVDGRRRAFDRACAPLCAGGELKVTSFEGCQGANRHGRKYVDWCRKGYDSILQNPDAFLVEPPREEEGAPPEPASRPADVLVESEPVSEPVNTATQSESAPVPGGEAGVEAGEEELEEDDIEVEEGDAESADEYWDDESAADDDAYGENSPGDAEMEERPGDPDDGRPMLRVMKEQL